MNKSLRAKAVSLRVNKRMSYSQIGKLLSVSKSTLCYWLKDYPLTEDEILELRRKGWQAGEASRERFRNSMRLKKQGRAERVYNQILDTFNKDTMSPMYAAGLMLYAAEGAKKDDYRIIVANTDARLINFFIAWLEKFLSIHKKQLRFQLHLYEGMDIKKEINHWVKILGISSTQLYKPQIRPLRQHSFSYMSSEENRHGTCSLQYSNRDHKLELMMGIRVFMDLHT